MLEPQPRRRLKTARRKCRSDEKDTPRPAMLRHQRPRRVLRTAGSPAAHDPLIDVRRLTWRWCRWSALRRPSPVAAAKRARAARRLLIGTRRLAEYAASAR